MLAVIMIHFLPGNSLGSNRDHCQHVRVAWSTRPSNMQQHTRSVGPREPLDERGGEGRGVKLEQCVQPRSSWDALTAQSSRLEMVIVTLLALARARARAHVHEYKWWEVHARAQR